MQSFTNTRYATHTYTGKSNQQAEANEARAIARRAVSDAELAHAVAAQLRTRLDASSAAEAEAKGAADQAARALAQAEVRVAFSYYVCVYSSCSAI